MPGCRLSICLVGLLLLGGAGCRGEGTPGHTIVLLLEAPVTRLDPRYALTSWEVRVSQLVAPGLIGLRDLGLGPTDGLAGSLVREGDRTYLATLRPDVRFSDGRPVGV